MVSKVKLSEIVSVFDKRNTEGKALPVYGINKDNEFMPTVANLEGVDTSKYKILTKGVFAFNGMHVGRDIAIPIGKYNFDSDALISPAYTTFTINKNHNLLVEYFEVIIRVDEFDRLAWFYCDSSVRGGLDWKRFLDIEIPLPSLSEQQKVVNAWKAFREIKEQNEAKAAPLMQLCQSYIQELKHKYPAQEIGPYIEECNERNVDGKYGVEELRGVTSEGIFDTSKAKTDGLNFLPYKVVHNGEFAYNPSRINLGSIAMLDEEISIISPMYIVFKLNSQEIHPQYLSIWFRRTEFQRSTLFYASGSVRDTFDINEMRRVRIPLPPLDVQRAIVNIYKCANEAKQIAAEADRLSREVCPALLQHIINL